MITLKLSSCLIYYLLIGYILAFNTCCKFERKNNISLGLFNTGVVALVYLLFWPIVIAFNELLTMAYFILSKMHENEEVKGEK